MTKTRQTQDKFDTLPMFTDRLHGRLSTLAVRIVYTELKVLRQERGMEWKKSGTERMGKEEDLSQRNTAQRTEEKWAARRATAEARARERDILPLT